jgi:uncharacterized protein YxjI
MLYLIPDGWFPGHALHVENAEGRTIARIESSFFEMRKQVRMINDRSDTTSPAEFIIKKAFWSNTFTVMKADEQPVFEVNKDSFFRQRYRFTLSGISFELSKPALFANRYYELYRVQQGTDEKEQVAIIQSSGFFSRSWEVETNTPLPEWLQVCVALISRMLYQQAAAAAGGS